MMIDDGLTPIKVLINTETLATWVARSEEGYRLTFSVTRANDDGCHVLVIHTDHTDKIGCWNCQPRPA